MRLDDEWVSPSWFVAGGKIQSSRYFVSIRGFPLQVLHCRKRKIPELRIQIKQQTLFPRASILYHNLWRGISVLFERNVYRRLISFCLCGLEFSPFVVD